MPDHCLEGFRMRRDGVVVDSGNDTDGVAHLGGISTIATNYPDDLGTDFPSIFQSLNKIGRDVLFEITPANGKYEQRILSLQLADLEPFDENRSPALVIGPRC